MAFKYTFVVPILEGFDLCDIKVKLPHYRFRSAVQSKYQKLFLEITALFEVLDPYNPENSGNTTQDGRIHGKHENCKNPKNSGGKR